MFGSSSPNADRIESMIHGTGDKVKKLLGQHRQMPPNSLQHPDDDVAPSKYRDGSSNHQPGKLLGLQLPDLTPGHFTDFPVLGEESLTTPESEGNILTPRAILTPEDYVPELRSSSTAANHSASEPMIAKSQYVERNDRISDIINSTTSVNAQFNATEKFSN